MVPFENRLVFMVLWPTSEISSQNIISLRRHAVTLCLHVLFAFESIECDRTISYIC